MTDEFNTASLEDHQSQQILRAMDFTEEEYRTSSELYQEGVDILRRHGIDPRLDQSGGYAYHRLYIKVKPPAIAGVTYQDTFRVCLELHTPNHQLLLENLINNMEKEVRKFWLPLVEPDPTRRKPIYMQALRMLVADTANRQINSLDPFDLGISMKEHSGCRAWIPRRESFSPSLYDVTFRDVFTLLPEAEAELLQLLIGRTVIGRDNSKLMEGEVIRHTARMAGIIVGSAGLGKSTLFNLLVASLRRVGYIVETFGNIASRFNLAPIALSHLCYKDDMSMPSFRQTLASENTKIMVTGGWLRTEDKGVNALNTQCNTVILANINDYDPRVMYDIDSGIGDRIKPLDCYRESQLPKLPRSPMIQGTPTLKPYQHLPWLADKLGVDLTALMLWAARLSADKFYDIVSQGVSGSSVLEQEVRTLTSKCRIQFRLDATEILLACAYFCHTLRYGNFNYGLVPEFPTVDNVALGAWLGSMELIIASPDLRPVRELIKGQYLESGKNKFHPQSGFELVSARSLLVAYQASIRMKELNGLQTELQTSFSNHLKSTLAEVRLQDGFGVSSDPIWVTQSWNNVRYHAPAILGWVKDIKAKLELAVAENPEDWRMVVDILHSNNYKCSLNRYQTGGYQVPIDTREL